MHFTCDSHVLYGSLLCDFSKLYGNTCYCLGIFMWYLQHYHICKFKTPFFALLVMMSFPRNVPHQFRMACQAPVVWSVYSWLVIQRPPECWGTWILVKITCFCSRLGAIDIHLVTPLRHYISCKTASKDGRSGSSTIYLVLIVCREYFILLPKPLPFGF